MLAFFRKLRKSLIEKGSARKYLLYAIGEIALVVIGILIAIQINNWNQERQNGLLEKDYLFHIYDDLQRDLREIGRAKDNVCRNLLLS